MIRIEEPSFTSVVQSLADYFGVKAHNEHFAFNSGKGIGFFWVEKLPSGITLLVCDTLLTEQLLIEISGTKDCCFLLQFNEEFEKEAEETGKRRTSTGDMESFVKLNHTLAEDKFVLPAARRHRSLKFFFTEKHLSSSFGEAATGQFFSQHFSRQTMSGDHREPLAEEFRVLLDELWVEHIEQPLRLNFIQNRIFLLLEKYIVKLSTRSRATDEDIDIDEVMRLMKVEALLVNDFSLPPPTVDALTKVAAMSATKLKADFKTLYGFPIYQYYQKARMNRARRLIQTERFAIREVGSMIGYSNFSHFGNAFKKEFGHLPSEI